MARKPRPWFREERNAWFVKLDGKYVWLGDHPEGAAKPKKNAKGLWNVPAPIDDAFHKIMASPTHVRSGTVWEVFDSFLDWTQANRAPRTYEWYQERLQRFKDARPNIPVEKLIPDHVYQWLNDKTWSDTYKRGSITAICRAFNWAVKARKITFSPLRGIEKPEAAHREQVISQEEFHVILANINDEPFRDLLKTVWLTGCRPQEVSRVEARHVREGYWEFLVKESKGKKKRRVVFLVPEAQEITEKWAARNSEGPIFRNNDGKPWRATAFNNRFVRLQIEFGKQVMKEKGIEISEKQIAEYAKKLKPQRRVGGQTVDKTDRELFREARFKLTRDAAVKLAPKICMYAIRHSYAHNGLTKGKVDPVVMATLLGHTDTKMLMKTYGHLLHDPEFMREAALRATSGVSAEPKKAAKPRGTGGGTSPNKKKRPPR